VLDFAELLLALLRAVVEKRNPAGALSRPLQAYPRRRIPGHQPVAILLAQIAGGPNNTIFGVGDDDQSIYAFRGARAGNMLDFEKDFHVEKVIKLEQKLSQPGQHPGCGQCADPPQPRRLGKNLLDGGKAAASRCGCTRR